jgi:hypothetical protein
VRRIAARVNLGSVNAEEPRVEDDEYEAVEEAGGDPACWAGLVCQECGAVMAEGHRPGCSVPGQPEAR